MTEPPGDDPANGGEEQGRDDRGRFQRGRSGNPAGRPRGSRNRATVLLDLLGEAHAETIVRRLIAQAEGGDTTAAEAILRRCWPLPRGRRATASRWHPPSAMFRAIGGDAGSRQRSSR